MTAATTQCLCVWGGLVRVRRVSIRSDFSKGEGRNSTTLYRGVRGVLPASFFEPDVQGYVTAIDYAFTSTSSDRAEAIHYMSPGGYNVLWVLHCSSGADSAGQLRNGAVLRPLSQFPSEAETLLPPLCMLQVLREGGAADTTGAFRWPDKEGTNARRARRCGSRRCTCACASSSARPGVRASGPRVCSQ